MISAKIKILFFGSILFCSCNSQKIFEYDLNIKEGLDLAYLYNCIQEKKKADSLIEWKMTGDENGILFFNYRERYAFFKLEKESESYYLNDISYQVKSFFKEIVKDDKPFKYKVTNQTQFKVWMSKDNLSIYFCMINRDDTLIWVLSKNDRVYNAHKFK